MADPATRILERLETGSTSVDPHWGWERGASPGYDAAARRLHRVRVVVPGTERAEVRLRLVRLAQRAVEPPDAEVELPVAEHVFRFLGGGARLAKSYTPVGAPALEADPPLLVLALDVTHLGPGEHLLTATLPGSGRDPTEVRVTIARRPFHAFAVAPRDGAPRVRSATGLVRAQLRSGARQATAHIWRVLRHAWVKRGALTGAYQPVEAADVIAVTLFDDDLAPERTRWTVLPGGESEAPGAALIERLAGDDLGAWRTPADHEREGDGLGLPFPMLVGLPSQPKPDGSHPPRR